MADACGPRATLRAGRVFASPYRSASTQRNHGLRPDREPLRSSAAQVLTSVVVEVSPALRAIPTLIVTAGTVTPRAEALGAEAILRKPVGLRRLVDTIRGFC